MSTPDLPPSPPPVSSSPEPRLADQQEVIVAVVGIVLWVIATIVLIFCRDALQRHDATWWYWTCGLGLLLGLYGLRAALRRRRS